MSRASVSDRLAEAIRDSGESFEALGRRADVPASCVARFVGRRRGLKLETVDRLAEALGLALVPTGRAMRRR